MQILSLNTGSSTVKYAVFEGAELRPLARGKASRIGEAEGRVEHTRQEAGRPRSLPLPDHRAALQEILGDLCASGTLDTGASTVAVGHRVVHGGDGLTAPVSIDDAVLEAVRELGRLAPLHNPVNATGIEVARSLLPRARHVAVFDTAFHAGLPDAARCYAIPERLAQRGYRRYGFHGISHGFVAVAAAERLGRSLDTLRLITLHLGNGASAAAIRNGRSVDTSMGMTPLEGLVMGTRSGDLDPAVVLRLVTDEGMAPADVEALLNHDSGLLALVGTNDVRDIEQRACAGDERAERALELFCYRVKKCIGAYWAALGGADAIVFTGGIGENAAGVRERCCDGLQTFGIVLDDRANRRNAEAVHAADVPVLVIETDEEREIARATQDVLRAEDESS